MHVTVPEHTITITVPEEVYVATPEQHFGLRWQRMPYFRGILGLAITLAAWLITSLLYALWPMHPPRSTGGLSLPFLFVMLSVWSAFTLLDCANYIESRPLASRALRIASAVLFVEIAWVVFKSPLFSGT